MNVESLRDNNQIYCDIFEYKIKYILLIRDNLTKHVSHLQIIGLMILFGSMSIVLPIHLIGLLIFDHFIFLIFVIFVLSLILFFNRFFLMPYSLIDECFITCNNAAISIKEYRLIFTHQTNLELEYYERLGFFQHRVYLSQLILINDKFVQLTKHWTFFHDKKTRSDIKQINEKIIQIAKEKLKVIDDFTDVCESSEVCMAINEYIDIINIAKKQIGMKI